MPGLPEGRPAPIRGDKVMLRLSSDPSLVNMVSLVENIKGTTCYIRVSHDATGYLMQTATHGHAEQQMNGQEPKWHKNQLTNLETGWTMH